MSKDTIKVNMNVYDIPILVEQLKKLEQENKQLKEEYKKVRDELLQYEIQNSKLQKELVELRVNTGRSVILGDKE